MVFLSYIIVAILIVPCAGVICRVLDLDNEQIRDVLFLNFFAALILLYFGICEYLA